MHRDRNLVIPVSPNEILKPNDVLLFMGKSETIVELVNSGNGLRFPKHDDNLEIVEAVVPGSSSLAGKQTKEAYFKKTTMPKFWPSIAMV